jgi:hypothetical protein
MPMEIFMYGMVQHGPMLVRLWVLKVLLVLLVLTLPFLVRQDLQEQLAQLVIQDLQDHKEMLDRQVHREILV